ncbi:MAG: hypothetical protein ACLFQK_01235 [Fibrobacterota bacterium]
MELRIAAVQLNSKERDKEADYAAMDRFIEKAATTRVMNLPNAAELNKPDIRRISRHI